MPRMPTNWPLENPANPYRDYSVEKLYEFLGADELPRTTLVMKHTAR